MSLTFLTQLYCLFVLQTLQPRLLFRAKSGKGESVRLLLSDFCIYHFNYLFQCEY